MTDLESTKWNPPTFSGKKEDWGFFETLMQSDLEQAGCDELLDVLDDEEVDIPIDSDNPGANSLEAKLKKQNKKAFNRLLRAFDMKDDLSKVAFLEVKEFKNENEGPRL